MSTKQPPYRSHGITRGCRRRIHKPGHVLHGARVTFLRYSQRSGLCAVRMDEDRGHWTCGSLVWLKPKEV